MVKFVPDTPLLSPPYSESNPHLNTLLRVLHNIMDIRTVTLFKIHHRKYNIFTMNLPGRHQRPALLTDPLKTPPWVLTVRIAACPGEEHILLIEMPLPSQMNRNMALLEPPAQCHAAVIGQCPQSLLNRLIIAACLYHHIHTDSPGQFPELKPHIAFQRVECRIRPILQGNLPPKLDRI